MRRSIFSYVDVIKNEVNWISMSDVSNDSLMAKEVIPILMNDLQQAIAQRRQRLLDDERRSRMSRIPNALSRQRETLS